MLQLMAFKSPQLFGLDPTECTLTRSEGIRLPSRTPPTIRCCFFYFLFLGVVTEFHSFLFSSLPHPADNTTLSGKDEGGTSPNYVAFVLVPVFFLLGLLGVVICHMLKRKGYRCTTEPQDGEEDKCAGEEEGERDPELGEGTGMFSAAMNAGSGWAGGLLRLKLRRRQVGLS